LKLTFYFSTFGRILPAYIGDTHGVFNVMIGLTLLGSIFTLAIWLPSTNNATTIAYAVLYGFTSGCTFSILPAVVASFSDIRRLGTRTGAMYAVSAFGALIGSPIAGAIVNAQHGGYRGLIVLSGVGILVGTGFAIAARQALVGGKLMVKV
jgi:MFS family permease